jgi:serine/threonine protein phosphatase PrpC
MFQTSQIIQPAEGSGQDRLVVLRTESRVIIAIADGAGGRSGGAEAADLAAKLIGERAETLSTQADCERLLTELDGTVASNNAAGETTAVVAIVSSAGIVGASVGDSGAWLVSATGIDDLTKNQIRKPFIGTRAAIPIGFTRAGLDGTLLVATDGLLKYTSREKITVTIQQSDFDTTPAALVSLVRYVSGALPDDVTCAICRLIK